MNRFSVIYLLALAMLSPPVALAETSGALQVTESTLNEVVERIGAQTDSGVHTILIDIVSEGYTMCDSLGPMLCPPFGRALPVGPAPKDLIACWDVGGGVTFFPSGTVTWKWWIAGARFTIEDGAMSFTATVGSDIDGEISFVRQTVPATFTLSDSGDSLKVDIIDFEVSIAVAGDSRPIAIVDLDELYGVSLEFDALAFDVQPGGGEPAKTVTASIRPIAEEDGGEGGVIVEYGPGVVVIQLNVDFREAES